MKKVADNFPIIGKNIKISYFPILYRYIYINRGIKQILAKKNGLLLVVVIVLSLLLAACGGNKESGEAANNNTIRDNPRNHTAEDFMPISEGFEEFSVWIESEENPVRDSKIKDFYVFDDDEVSMYPIV